MSLSERQSGNRSKIRKTDRFSEHTDIVANYGEKSWRPVQSVIDLIQNHLDANNTIFEKNLLWATSINDYNPISEYQQKLISLLEQFKYATDEDTRKKIYSNLYAQDAQGVLTSFDMLTSCIQKINFKKPDLFLKVSAKGEKTQFVPYEDASSLDTKWKVVGFRVSDIGAGFDKGLLGTIGASTKKDISSRRGGLGEGLKMSVTHLARAGVKVRVGSENEDERWIAYPDLTNERVMFKGLARKDSHAALGSVTDVDFSNSKIDEKFRAQLRTTLDPRLGEGIGKYILEYRGDQFMPLVNQTTELFSLGVPNGRIYVKGLLVEERNDLLFSYNNQNKWAIQGRDRKTVGPDVIDNMVEGLLKNTKDSKVIQVILGGLASGKRFQELQCIDSNFDIDEDRRNLWKDMLEKYFKFIPRETLFILTGASEIMRRIATSLGYSLVDVSSSNYNIISFFEKLYEDEALVSFYQLRDRLTSEEIAAYSKEFSSDAKPLTNRENLQFAQLQAQFVKILENHDIRGSQNIIETKLERDPFKSNGSVIFRYNPNTRTLYLRVPELPDDLKTKVDLWVEFSKVVAKTEVFDIKSQDILTQLLGNTFLKSNPNITRGFKMGYLSYEQVYSDNPSYSREQRQKDIEILKLWRYINLINDPDIELVKLQKIVDAMKDLEVIKDNDIVVDANCYVKEYFYFNNQLYRFDITKPSLEATHAIIVNPSKKDVVMKTGQWQFFPISLKLKESMRFSITRLPGVKNGEMIIYRQGNTIKVRIITDDSEREYDLMLDTIMNYVDELKSHISVGNNCIGILPNARSYTLKLFKAANNQSKEAAHGQEFLATKIAIDYGERVWKDPVRVLLDAIQNHLDADKNRKPEITYTIVNKTGQMLKVTQGELAKLDNLWRVIGIRILDEGDGYPTHYLTTLGDSTKENDNRGKFGEGLKMLAASCVKQGIFVTFGSRDWQAKPMKYSKGIRDYETGSLVSFEFLGYKMKWHDPVQGSFTEFFLFDELNSEQLLKEQYNSLWKQWVDILDPRMVDKNTGKGGLDRFMVSPEDILSKGDAIAALNLPGMVFEKGLLIPQPPSKPMVFGYNIDKNIVTTRERNSYSEDIVNAKIGWFLNHTQDQKLYRIIFDCAAQKPFTNFLEYEMMDVWQSFSHGSRASLRQAYYEKFGSYAILSLRPLLEKREAAIRAAYPYDSYTQLQDKLNNDVQYKNLQQFVYEERHLDRGRLCILPANITSAIQTYVYSSKDFLEESQNKDIKIPDVEHQRIVDLIHRVNTAVVCIVDQLQQDSNANILLQGLLPKDIEERKKYLLEFPPDKLKIKPRTFPFSGTIQQDSMYPEIVLNQGILANPTTLIRVYLHEACHYLSDESDYNRLFERMLALLAMKFSEQSPMIEELYQIEKLTVGLDWLKKKLGYTDN